MPRFKDQAIILRVMDWSETSQIAALLTEHHGKVPVLAKGAKRQSPSATARYSGGLEVLTRGQAVGAIKATAELATLTEWDLQAPHPHLRQNLRAQQLAFYAADLANNLLADHDPHPAAFQALAHFVAALHNPEQHGRALLRYQWSLLTDCGYKPDLDTDIHTNTPLNQGNRTPRPRAYAFDAGAGGFTTHTEIATTTGDTQGPWKVRASTLALLRQTNNNPSNEDTPTTAPSTPVTPATPADPVHVTRANRLLCVYARAILGRQLNTMPIVLNAV